MSSSSEVSMSMDLLGTMADLATEHQARLGKSVVVLLGLAAWTLARDAIEEWVGEPMVADRFTFKGAVFLPSFHVETQQMVTVEESGITFDVPLVAVAKTQGIDLKALSEGFGAGDLHGS